MLAALPIATPVTVEVQGWARPFASRVDDVDDEVLTVTGPGAGLPLPAPGDRVAVSWLGPFGIRRQPAVLLVVAPGAPARWRLRPEGAATVAQRRSHTRATTLVPAVVLVDGFRVDVRVVDLSESGAHLVTGAPAPLVAGELVGVGLDLDGARFALPTAVVRVEEVDGRLHAGCRFLEPSSDEATRLRRYVFRRQALERARLRR